MNLVNYSGIMYETHLGKILRLPLALVPNNMILPILKGRAKGKRWIAGAGVHGYWLGSYEYDKQKIFETTIHKGAVVFDIGAHVGFYTLLASVLVGEQGRVFAFEPLPRNLSYLKRHLQLNGILNATVFEAAVSDRQGFSNFWEGTGNSMGRISPEGELEIEVVSIDELISQEKVSEPDYIKIDVEGSEMQVLRGAHQILAKRHPILFLATHGKAVHQQCCEFLSDLDYCLRPISPKFSIENSDEIVAFK